MKKYLVVFFIFISFNSLCKQFHIDSIKSNILVPCDDTAKINKLCKIAWHYILKRDTISLDYINKIKQSSIEIDYKEGQFSYLNLTAKYYFLLRDYKLSMNYYNQAYDFGLENGIYPGFANALYNISIINQRLGNYQEALTQCQKSFNIALMKEDTVQMGRYLTLIGNTYMLLSLQDKALDSYFKALNYLKKTTYLRGIAVCNMNIGVIYSDQGEHYKALSYFRKSLRIHTEIGRLNSQGGCLAHIAHVHFKRGNIDSAKYYYQQSDKKFKLWIPNEKHPRAFWGLGDVALKQNNFDSAYYFYNTVLKRWKKHKEQENILKAYNKLGEAYAYISDYKTACMYYDSAFIIGVKISSIRRIQEICYNLYKAKKQSGNLKEAIHYHELYILYKDSLYNDENRKKIIYTELANEFEQKQEIWELEKQNNAAILKLESLNHAKTKKSLTIIIVLLFSLLILISWFSNYNRKQKRLLKSKNKIISNINQELSAQNKEIISQKEEIIAQQDFQVKLFNKKIEAEQRELSSNLLLLSNKKKIEQNTISLLENIKTMTSLPQNLSEDINKNIHELKLGIDKNFWNEFEIRFTQINNGFLEKLDLLYPDLTYTERQICIFLKLGLNTKEISRISNKTIRSVEIARTRLRHKLGLKGEKTELSTFINSI